MKNIEEKIDKLTENVDKLTGAVGKLSQTVDGLAGTVSRLAETVDELAMMTKQGFDSVGKETSEIKFKLDGLVKHFEFDALERRVVDLELKLRQN